MSDASVGAMVLRTVVSMAVVLGIVAVAYVTLKRRGPIGSATPRSGISTPTPSPRG